MRDIAAWHRCVASRGMPWCLRHYNPQQLVKGMYGEVREGHVQRFVCAHAVVCVCVRAHCGSCKPIHVWKSGAF